MANHPPARRVGAGFPRPRLAWGAVTAPLLLLGCETAPPPVGVGLVRRSPKGEGGRPLPHSTSGISTFDEFLESKRDLWGEAALKQPGGPSYEFFAKLLPPPRYVNATFREYPIVLSAPGAAKKARLVSNGSAVNAKGGHKSWHDVGIPVTFRCGEDRDLYGNDPARLDGPRYAEGWLPIVQLRYRVGDAVYAQEAFAAVDPGLADRAAVFVRFTLEKGDIGTVEAELDAKDDLTLDGGNLRDAKGRTVLAFAPKGEWKRGAKRLVLPVRRGEPVVVGVFADGASSNDVGAGSPRPRPAQGAGTAPLLSMDEINVAKYDDLHRSCVETWRGLINPAVRIETPEPVVNNAWRSMIVGNYMLLNGDRMLYSAGNQYEGLYVHEGSDAVRSLMLYGHLDDGPPLMRPIFDSRRKGLEFHRAGYKLQMLAHYYWLTRDAAFLKSDRGRWEREVKVLLDGRDPETGLLRREQYCGDIPTLVVSLNSHANGWRGLRDMSAVLADAGEKDEADRLAKEAAAFRKVILAAVAKSVRRDVSPPFVPNALFGDEAPYDRITGTKMGSYYNLMAPSFLGAEVFPSGAPEEGWILDTLNERGGIAMGMIRSRPLVDLMTVKQGTNHLYGRKYDLANLKRDDADRALVSFYGTLAQGFTRDTFTSGESIGLGPLDDYGRPMYLPPNSGATAHWLWLLRYLLVQDWDLDDDGEPETLRLLFATTRRWLEAGKTIRVERAPTAFGEVSVVAKSRLAKGEVSVTVTPPPRAPKRMLLRARVPEGQRVISAKIGDKTLAVDGKGTVDLTGMTGTIALVLRVR